MNDHNELEELTRIARRRREAGNEPVDGRKLGQEVCNVLGLDANRVSELVIRIPASGSLIVEVVMGVTSMTASGLAYIPETFKRYKLVEVADEEANEAPEQP